MKKGSYSSAAAIVLILLLIASSGSGLGISVSAESDPSEEQLIITGLVEHPLSLSTTELAAMPQTTVYATLICVGSPNSVVAEGNWVGVSLWLLLETAEVYPEAVKVAFFATDGYSTDLTIEEAKREDVILAYERDGMPLEETLRLIVPGKWGYKWIAMVEVVELVDYDFLGFWESQGYDDYADIGEGAVPEFSSAIAILLPLILIGLVTVILKERTKKPQTRKPPFPIVLSASSQTLHKRFQDLNT